MAIWTLPGSPWRPHRGAANPDRHSSRIPIVRLIFIAFLAVLIHGYHLGVDDSEIYIPAIKRAVDPALYPLGSEFFETHARLSVFPNLVAIPSRLTRLPVNASIFLLYLIGVFLMVLGCWRLACAAFDTDRARWGAVAAVAGVLTVPVAGTALILMDPYLTARSLSTPATIFAIAAYVSGKPRQAVAWLLFTALIHPQMSVFCAAFLGCMALEKRASASAIRSRLAELAPVAGFAFLFDFKPAHGAAREALFSRSYFFVTSWAWYEWIGVFAPLALLWGFSRANLRGTTEVFRSLARTLVPFGLVFTAAGLVLASSPRLENLTRLQPMRSFHLLYAVFFVFLGGLLGEYFLQGSIWRWLGFFAPLAALMWSVQWKSFPNSSHVEWPGRERNEWTAAFVWVRDHTPKDAVFALEPNYMLDSHADLHGFRAIAERSALADNVKDSGAVSLFPQLAVEWKMQVRAQDGLADFQMADFENLANQYPVTWMISRRPKLSGLICPYQNRAVYVCRIDKVSLLLAAAESNVGKVLQIPAGSDRPMLKPVLKKEKC